MTPRLQPEDQVRSADASLSTRWLDSAEANRWDEFVQRHPLGVVYHLSHWRRIIESSFPHIRGRFLVVEDPKTKEILAGVPLYLVSSWLLGTRWVSIPFASICDPLVSDDAQWEALLLGIEEARRARRNCPFECRTWKRSVPPKSLQDCSTEVALHHTLDLTPGPEALYLKFSRTAIRRMISKGQAQETKVRAGESLDDLHQFYQLLVCSRRRLGLPAIPAAYFRSIWTELPPENRFLIIASRDNRPIASALSLRLGKTFILEYSGEDNQTTGTGAGQMVYWEAIKTACALGCSEFSFGRTAVENTGLASYKLHWGTVEEKLITFWPGSLPIQRRSVAGPSRSRRAISWLSHNAPPAIYQAMSRFCYRHWG